MGNRQALKVRAKVGFPSQKSMWSIEGDMLSNPGVIGRKILVKVSKVNGLYDRGYELVVVGQGGDLSWRRCDNAFLEIGVRCARRLDSQVEMRASKRIEGNGPHLRGY
jgi:hypothetical protein